jgi:hypothetical protein
VISPQFVIVMQTAGVAAVVLVIWLMIVMFLEGQ